MGQNEAARRKDVSRSSGPLWCLPITPDLGAVWGHRPVDVQLIGVEGPSGLSTPLDHQRIFSPQHAVAFAVLPLQGLHDGQRVVTRWRDETGSESEEVLDFRLAKWRSVGAPQVVSQVASRLLPEMNGPDAAATLRRYLALIASWRLPGRLSAVIGDHAFYSFDTDPQAFAPRHGCLLSSGAGLQPAMLRSFAAGGETVLIVPRGSGDHAYTDVNGDLVQLDLPSGTVSEQDSAAWVRGLEPEVRNRLLDHLSDAARGGAASCPHYLTASLKEPLVELAEPDAGIDIRAAFAADCGVVMFLKATGTAALQNIRIHAFGAGPGDATVPEVIAYHEITPETLPLQWLALKAPLAAAPQACRIEAEVGGQTIRQWVHIQPACNGRGLRFAQSFWPLAESDERFLSLIGAPLARAWASVPAAQPAYVLQLPRARTSPAIDLQVAAEADAQGRFTHLRSSLLALRASLPEKQSIRVTLLAGDGPEEGYRAVGDWTRQLGLDARIELIPAHMAAPAALRVEPETARELHVALRAGFAPPHGGWIDEVAGQLRQTPATVLIGISRDYPSERLPQGDLTREAILDLLDTEAISAMAASAELIGALPAEAASCCGLSGAWVEWLCHVLDQGGRILNHQALNLFQAEPGEGRFVTRVDSINLSRKKDVTQYHEQVTLRNNVNNA